MSATDPRVIFAGLCWFGMIAILLGAAWEIRGKLKNNFLSDAEFWVRMLSAVCWLIALGLMSYAVMAHWPRPHDEISKRIFAQFLLAGLCFLLAAILISIVDFVLTWRIRKAYRRQLAQQMDQWIQGELSRPQTDEHTEIGNR